MGLWVYGSMSFGDIALTSFRVIGCYKIPDYLDNVRLGTDQQYVGSKFLILRLWHCKTDYIGGYRISGKDLRLSGLLGWGIQHCGNHYGRLPHW